MCSGQTGIVYDRQAAHMRLCNPGVISSSCEGCSVRANQCDKVVPHATAFDDAVCIVAPYWRLAMLSGGKPITVVDTKAVRGMLINRQLRY